MEVALGDAGHRFQAAARHGQRDCRRDEPAPVIDSSRRRHGRQHLDAVKEVCRRSRAASRHHPHQPDVQRAGRRRRRRRLGRLGRGEQPPLQRPADRRRGQQRPVRPGEFGRRARRHGRNARQSVSTPSRRSSWLFLPSTCGRAASPAAASMPSPRAAPNAFRGTAFFFGRNQDWVGKGADDRAISTSRTSRAASASAAPSSRTRRSSSAPRTTAARSARPGSR